jgi:hypothetical protein
LEPEGQIEGYYQQASHLKKRRQAGANNNFLAQHRERNHGLGTFMPFPSHKHTRHAYGTAE